MTKITNLAWSAKVSDLFCSRVVLLARNLDSDPNFFMACMAFESAETFRADIKNAAGSGATGLIQFMPQVASLMGTSVEALAAMTPEDQLDYVRRYFEPHRGRLRTLGDVYMAILWPRGVGKGDDFVLFDKNSPAPRLYLQNRGLDRNLDGVITRGEACAAVRAKLAKGLLPQNIRAFDLILSKP